MSATLAVTFALLLSQSLRGEGYLADIERAMDPVYRLDYEEAIERLGNLSERYPDHPGPPLAEASAIWLRELFRRQDFELDRFVSPGYFTQPSDREMPPHERERFGALVAESQERARRLLEEDEAHPDARYYLGGAEGVLGAFDITIGRSKLDALGHGRSAYRWHRELVEDEPHYYDAYMTVGTYEYLLDNLPWYVKWIAVIAGYTGSEQLGFEYLVRAAVKGRFVATDARVLLMVLYVREGQHEYALRLADDLSEMYPENFLFPINAAQILEKMGRRKEALDRYVAIEKTARAGAPNYQKLALNELRLAIGERLYDGGELSAALERFRAAAEAPDAPADVRARAHLEAGQVLDLLGRRHEALSHYARVRAMQDVEGSRRLAEKYSRKPFDERPRGGPDERDERDEP